MCIPSIVLNFKKSLFTLCPNISLGVWIFHPSTEILVPWGSKYLDRGSKYFKISGRGSAFSGVQIFHDRWTIATTPPTIFIRVSDYDHFCLMSSLSVISTQSISEVRDRQHPQWYTQTCQKRRRWLDRAGELAHAVDCLLLVTTSYLSESRSSLSAFVISKTHISGYTPHGRRKSVL